MMTKKQIHIYPDYCSSGIWGDTGNMDESEINMDYPTKMALEYWHRMWESWNLGITKDTIPRRWFITGFYTKWWNDGKQLCESIQEQNPDLDVVYMADTPEEIMEVYYGENV